MPVRKDMHGRIPANKLFYDPTYQRLDKDGRIAWAKKTKPIYDENLLGHLVVSARNNDRFALLDGAGRHLLVVEQMGLTDHVFDAIVFYGLTIAEEAKIFKAHFNRRRMNTSDGFKV